MYFGILLHNPPTNFQVNWFFKESSWPKITAYRRSSWGFGKRVMSALLRGSSTKKVTATPGFEVVALCCQFGHPKTKTKNWLNYCWKKCGWVELRVRKVHLVGWTTEIKNMFNMSEWKKKIRTRKRLSWIWLNFASRLMFQTSLLG